MIEIQVKKCIKCDEIKPVCEFYKSKRHASGLMNECIKCKNKRSKDAYYSDIEKSRARGRSEKKKEYSQLPETKRKRHESYLKRKEENKEKRREYEKRDSIILYRKEYAKTPKRKASLKRYASTRVAERREAVRKYRKSEKYRKTLNEYIHKTEVKLIRRLRNRVYFALKSQNANKIYKAIELVGCDMVFLKRHLESQFQKGMTWDNHGVSGWHIDHIVPCDHFDLTKPEEQKKCFHWSNLRPLWAKENLSKGNRLLAA
jgi:hypothetical protein